MVRRLFSGREILISFLAISMIFAYPAFLSDPSSLFIYFVVLGVAFIGHELSHKFTAIRLGYWSEYRMWKEGLLMALVFALATGGSIVFAAPGAVYFALRSPFQRMTKRHVGLIGIAGPLFNAVAFSASAVLFLATGSTVFYILMIANAFLGLFNMLPFGPLDGRKIRMWNQKAWIVLFSFLVVALLATI
ncbi:MAG: site-2 protease family protein [Candidatus Aenigmarchaeota archaeon]|nr:site-2 protease family protein [Candidatus Aenigmarchaeota archaeon]